MGNFISVLSKVSYSSSLGAKIPSVMHSNPVSSKYLSKVQCNLMNFVRLRDDDKDVRCAFLVALLERSFSQHTLVFIQTRREVHHIYVILQLMGIKVRLLYIVH